MASLSDVVAHADLLRHSEVEALTACVKRRGSTSMVWYELGAAPKSSFEHVGADAESLNEESHACEPAAVSLDVFSSGRWAEMLEIAREPRSPTRLRPVEASTSNTGAS